MKAEIESMFLFYSMKMKFKLVLQFSLPKKGKTLKNSVSKFYLKNQQKSCEILQELNNAR